MKEVRFTPSDYDPCLYYKKNVVMLIYIDYCFVFSPDPKLNGKIISDLSNSNKYFEIDDQSDVSDFLGIEVIHVKDTSINLTQPHLIDAILNDLHLQENTKEKSTPALSFQLLCPDVDGEDMGEASHCRSVIGKLNFLEKSTRIDISYSVHQCACCSDNPKKSHSSAVKNVGSYLKGTRDKGLILMPDKLSSFECWVDSDFEGNWRPQDAPHDSMTSKSRAGWAIQSAGFPLTWAYKIHTITTLSTTEAEYVALSMSIREVMPLMGLLKEIKHQGFEVQIDPPSVHCKLFEDNSGDLELARLPKIRPRTKHINQSYHFFCEAAERNEVSTVSTPTENLLADMLTKPLPEEPFVQHHKNKL